MSKYKTMAYMTVIAMLEILLVFSVSAYQQRGNKNNLLDVDKVYIALSPDWIPYEYQSLYRIWEQFFKEDS